MDDQHWLLNTTLAGAVFVVVFSFCVWALTGSLTPSPCELIQPVTRKGVSETLASLAVIGAALTLLGMAVRIFSVVLWSPFQYGDEARKLVGSLSREAFSTTEGLPNSVRERITSKIESAPDDSLFICYTLPKKPERLVGWVRNRRHYQYVGENSFVASLLGIAAALLYVTGGTNMEGWVKRPWHVWLPLGLWVAALLYLRFQMKQAIDRMELAWVCGIIDKCAKRRVMASFSLRKAVIKPGLWERIRKWLFGKV